MSKDHWHYFLAHHIQQKVSSGHTNSLPHHGVRKSQKKCLIQHGVKQCYQAAGYFQFVLLNRWKMSKFKKFKWDISSIFSTICFLPFYCYLGRKRLWI